MLTRRAQPSDGWPAAMRQHPEMVSGEKRTDLALGHAGRGDWIAKAGAEGVQAVAVRSQGLGIAIKVADGHAREPRVQ